MKKVTALVLAVIIYATASSQCLPEGIIFTTQAQIDSFQTDYSGCTEIEGFVKISGEGITNLNGLSELRAIGEYLWLDGCSDLTSLSGLGNLDTIGVGLSIEGSSTLTSLHGLEGINYLAYVELSYNWGLTSLEGLNNLNSIEGCLYMQHNGLIDFTGFESLRKIKGCVDINWHNNLVSFSGLDSLQYIGDYFWILTAGSLSSISALSNLDSIGGGLFILETGLTSLEGLDNIAPSSISTLTINGNGLLSTCQVKSVCEYLENPNGYVQILNNAVGCDNQEEVEEACLVGVKNENNQAKFSIYPNPFTMATTFSYTLQVPYTVHITIFNYLGEQVAEIRREQSEGKQQVVWNAQGMPSGVYFYRMQAGDQLATGKMLLVK